MVAEQANYRLDVNGVDVTDKVKPFFVSLRLTDNDGDEADELVLTLSAKFSRPAYGDKIKVFLGSPLTFVGLFFVQSTSVRNARELVINATGVDFNGDLKERRQHSYIDVTLGDVAREIAVRHGLNIKTNLMIGNRFEQKNESDMSFLNRLAKEYNAVFNIKNNTLYFVDQEMDVPSIVVDINRCTESDIMHSNTTVYKSCKAIYHSTKLNKAVSVIYGSGKPVLVEQGKWSNDDDALEAAKNALARANKGKASGSLSMRGQVVFAGSKLTLDKVTYQIKKVTHYVKNGWSTNLEFKNLTY